MPDFVINVAQAFIRSGPRKERGNELAVLPENTRLTEIGPKVGRWRHVRCQLVGATFEGYVSNRVLAPLEEIEVETLAGTAIPPVHYRPNNPNVRRTGNAGASPLGEAGMPVRRTADGFDPATLREFIEWADVENLNHKRWKKRGSLTFCNIYAYDYCYAAGVFIPRVWWKKSAIERLEAGDDVPVAYGDTIREMVANKIHDWLLDYGADYGWQRANSLDALQEAANQGYAAVICAARKTAAPGHITVVAPETAGQQAERVNGRVRYPLQSQAGTRNYQHSTIGSAWWSRSKFRSFVFYYNTQRSSRR